MVEQIRSIVDKYVEIYPLEKDKLEKLYEYLNIEQDVFDWNNFNGHITVGSFVYDKVADKFLVVYHKDLKMYLYPGGHVDKNDRDTLKAAIRELEEETGLKDLDNYLAGNDELVPFDIDIHKIDYNERLDLPSHYHFDFRYIFLLEKQEDINIDKDEIKDYRWISYEEFINNKEFGKIVNKLDIIRKKD